jgi:hypothetical protein
VFLLNFMTTTLFIVSCVGMFAMVGFKIFEIKVRKINTLANIWAKGDMKIHALLEKAYVKYNLYKKIAKIFLFDFLPALAYELSVKLKDYISRKYYEMGDKFRGRRILQDRGSVSAFLQHIAENKDVSNRKV